MAELLQNAEQVFLDNNGNPLVLGTVEFFIPNTSTHKNTWQDADETILNTNPVNLDAAGRAILYGTGLYRQLVKDVDGNTIWDQITGSIADTSSNVGFLNFVILPEAPPAVPGSGLTATLTAGTAMYNGQIVGFPAVTTTFGVSTITDYWLNPAGSTSVWTIETKPASNYTELPRYPNLVHVWRVETTDSAVAAINLLTDTYPVVNRPFDQSCTIDTLAELFYLYDSTTNWSASLSVTYGELIVVTSGAGAGNVYQVAVAGTTGSSSPTSTATGGIPDGSATLFYYSQSSYLGSFRYAQNNGILWYFSNIGLYYQIYKALLTGSPLGAARGTEMTDLVKKYLQKAFLHLVNERQNSATYAFGMKMVVAGFVWECRTYGGGTTAGSSPFSSGYSVGSTVVDSGVTWKAVYAWYAGQKWFWMDTERDFLTYKAPDSHDSYASTFCLLLGRYVQITGDFLWLTADSPQPNGSGFYTYAEVFNDVVQNNLIDLYNGSPYFLTQTFQGNINPSNGSSFDDKFLEDNCESYAGLKAAAYIYGILSDATNQSTADSTANLISSGIYNLYDVTYGIFTYVYGTPVSSFYNITTLQYYPWYQAQFWPELYNVPSVRSYMRLSVRLWVSQRWESWWSDKGRDNLPDNVHGFVAARSWHDNEKAYAFVENSDRYFQNNGTMIINEMAFYLATKDWLIQTHNVLRTPNGKIVFQNGDDEIKTFYTQQKLRASQKSDDFTLTLPANCYIDQILIHNNTSNAITGGLKIGSTAGGTDIVAAQTVGADAFVMVPSADILIRTFSNTLPQILYFADVGGWNSANINVKVMFYTLDFADN